MQNWSVFAHDEGVYSVDLNSSLVVSGGDEGTVRVWGRPDGTLLATLCHHDYIVWNVALWLDGLFTCSYDCSVAYLRRNSDAEAAGSDLFVLAKKLSGPLWWADAFCADRKGRYLASHDEHTFAIGMEEDDRLARSIARLCKCHKRSNLGGGVIFPLSARTRT